MSDMHESTTVEDPTMNPTERVKSEPDEVQVDEADKQDDTGWENHRFPEMNLSKWRIDNERPEKAIENLIDSFTNKVKTRAGETPVHGKKLPDGAKEGDVPAKRKLFVSDDLQSLEEVQGNVRTAKHIPSIRELELNDTTKREIEEHPSKYRVKLFVNTSTNDSEMSSAVNTIVDGDQRLDTCNTTKSFMFFFYKDKDPDIFVMTSGQAYRKVQSKTCEQFPKKVARRLLEFKTIKIETRNVTGKQEQTRKIFAPNHPEIPNILDLIHVIVHSYTASPRLASSLYDLKDFKEIKKCRFTINPFFLKAHAKLSFTGMLSFIKHVADIDKGKSTSPCDHRLVQCDKVENKKHSTIKDEQFKSDLEKWLLMHLDEFSINNIIVKSGLTGECSMHLKGKSIYSKKFDSPPTLRNMLKELTDGCVTVDKLAKIQLRREKDKKRIFITEYLDVPVTMNNKQYRFRKGKWWRNESEITDEKSVMELKKEFTEQIVEPLFHGSQIENNLTITNGGSEAFKLFESKKKNPYKRWDTLPTFRDICIALVEQVRGIKFSFSWFIENVQLLKGKRREHIGKYIGKNDDKKRIVFNYDGKRYIYSFVEKSFTKVDRSVKLEEEDDNQFNCFELIQEEKDEQMIEELVEKFDESLKNDADLCIPLSLPDLSEWLDVGTFKLFLPREQKPEKQWTGMPATLKELLDATGTCQTSLDWNTAKFTMQCKGGSTQKRRPITELLVHQITLREKPYFFWHGKWLKIKSEFVSLVSEKFKKYVKTFTLTREDFLPLPWVNTGTDKPEKGKDEESTSRVIKSSPFRMEDLIKFMKSKFSGIDDTTCRNVLKELSDKGTEPDTAKGIKYTKHQYKKNDKHLVMLMFLRVHSNLVELLYNTSYILYDKYLKAPGEGFIVGDQILTTNNIEMFDILKFDKKTTFLIHVKDGFGQTVRDVCSQIKNSAKLLFNSLTSDPTRSMLGEMWRTYTSDPTEGVQKLYRCATQEKMKELGRDCFLSLFNTNKRRVVYVLALREQRDLKWKEEMSMVEALAQHYGDEKTKDIFAVLKKQGFVTDELLGEYILTDKFRLQFKEEFTKTMTETSQKDLESIWGDVLDILKTYLPCTDSTIAQLEIVELFDNFDNQFGKKLTLKLFFLPTSLEDLEKAIVPLTEE